MSNRYDIREAFAVLACGGEATLQDVREALAMTTDIPADRLDFAAGELIQAVPQLHAFAGVVRLMLGRAPTTRDMLDCFKGANWIDDDKKTGTYQTTFEAENDDGSVEITTATIRQKLD